MPSPRSTQRRARLDPLPYMTANPYRNLPAVTQVLAAPDAAALVPEHGRPAVVEAIRAALAELRQRLRDGAAADGELAPAAVAARAAAHLAREAQPKLR